MGDILSLSFVCVALDPLGRIFACQAVGLWVRVHPSRVFVLPGVG